MTQIKKNDILNSKPLIFIKNDGYTNETVDYRLRIKNYQISFLKNQIIICLREEENNNEITNNTTSNRVINKTKLFKGKKLKNEKNTILKINFENTNKSTKIVGIDKTNTNISYLKGNDEGKWIKSFESFYKIRYEGIYNGIDLVFYENNKKLEFDFILKPGANANDIKINIEGSTRTNILKNGNLDILLNNSKINMNKPSSYQIINNDIVNIESKLNLKNNNITFDIDNYDKNLELIIDPILELSTYIGSSSEEHITSMVVDKDENIYIGGYTWSLAIDNQPLDPNFIPNYDIFVSKINKYGRLVFTTYISGNKNDYCNSIAVDEEGSIYLTGKTNSDDFPIKNPIQNYSNDHGNYDIFISKIRVQKDNDSGLEVGEITFSTYFGGSMDDCANSIAIRDINNVYITGYTKSIDFETLNPLQTYRGGSDIFITQISINESNLGTSSVIYSTTLGGTDGSANKIILDNEYNIYITGFAVMNDFIDTMNSYIPSRIQSIYVLKMDDAKNLIYAQYLGSDGYNEGTSIDVDSSKKVYISSYNKLSYNNNKRAYMYKLNENGSKVYERYFSGNGDDIATTIGLDENGYIYLGGYTNSSDFNPKNTQFSYNGNLDSFLVKMDSMGNEVFFIYLGGSNNDMAKDLAIDKGGNIYIAGDTLSSDFPTIKEIEKYNGGFDGFVSKIKQAKYINLGKINLLEMVDKDEIEESMISKVTCYSNSYNLKSLDIVEEIMKSSTAVDNICINNPINVIYEYKDVFLDVYGKYSIALFTNDYCLDNLKIYALDKGSIVTKVYFGCMQVNDSPPNKDDFELVINPNVTVLPDDFGEYYIFLIEGTIGLEYVGDMYE